MGRSPSKKRRTGKASGRRRAPKQAKKGPTKRTRPRASKPTSSKAEIARLSRELSEALAQQTASAEVLEIISSSIGDTQPAFERLLENATRVCSAQFGAMGLFDGEVYRRVAIYNVPQAFDTAAPKEWRPGPEAPIGRVLRTGQVLRIDDLRETPTYLAGHPAMVAMVEVAKARTLVIVPMLRDAKPIGAISIYRQDVGPFSDRQIELLKNFANQAVIAIENARLFNETTQALAQQTATSEVLRVISNSIADTAPVFEKILDSCENLFATEQLGIFVVQPDGQTHVGAWRGDAVETVIRSLPRPVEETATGAVIRNRAVLHIQNTATAENVPPTVQYTRDQYGDLSMAWAPMLTEQSGIGSIAVMRQPPNPFSDKELELLKTFADQAVIAIQNTRLFNETREALARQTATADVLKVIASSPSNLQPVFDAIAERSNELIGGHSTTVGRYVDGMVQLASFTPVNPEADAMLRTMFPSRPTTGDPQIAQVLRGEIARIAEAETEIQDFAMRETARVRGWRSRLLVPLKDDTAVIGWISVTRKEAGEFAEKDVELLRTFADQAVIAISNVELFQQVQAKTRDLEESLEQQTATSEVLRVISSSSGDLQPIFKSMLSNALEICEAQFGMLLLYDGKAFSAAELHNAPPAFAELFSKGPIIPGPNTGLGRTVSTRKVVHIPDILDDGADVRQSPLRIATIEILQARTFLAVPMLKESDLVGVIVIYRQAVRPFSDKQIELVTNFANQAVIAIENARLLNELRDRTEELSRSLDDLRAAQDRLVQTEKLASLGQLTAGIAHEIKNPSTSSIISRRCPLSSPTSSTMS